MIEQRYLYPLSGPASSTTCAQLASHMTLLESIKDHAKPTAERLGVR
jgi:hypothetical protein